VDYREPTCDTPRSKRDFSENTLDGPSMLLLHPLRYVRIFLLIHLWHSCSSPSTVSSRFDVASIQGLQASSTRSCTQELSSVSTPRSIVAGSFSRRSPSSADYEPAPVESFLIDEILERATAVLA
jgi:hypothetical protein